jgi:RNA polymerase sigma factor (sigma-70 family)
MKSNFESQQKREVRLEQAMFSLWLKESGEDNEEEIYHLKNCVRVAISECLTEKQVCYLSYYMAGYNQIEISEMCGVNKSTVSRTLNRGLKRLLGHIKYATPRTLRVANKVENTLMRLYK